MRSSAEIKTEIEGRLGFFPPFYQPAFETPAVLENLWQQTLTAYLDNPLPSVFKEKLAALIARECPVPYCLVCHSCTLRPLGMTPSAILALLETVPATTEALEAVAKALDELNVSLVVWPAAGSPVEDALLAAALVIFRNPRADVLHRALRRVLAPSYYNYLIIFLGYNQTCLTWAEAHPELSYEADKRVQDNLSEILREEPRLAHFFKNYQERIAGWLLGTPT